MKLIRLLTLMLPAAAGGLAATCAPGTLQDYINLGSGGCTSGSFLVADFALAAGIHLTRRVQRFSWPQIGEQVGD